MIQIILNSYREAIRDRVLIVVLIFGVLMIFSSSIIGPLSLGEDIRIAKDVGLSSISFFGILVVLFIGNRLIYYEINEKTIYLVLSRPINKFRFVFAKAFGLFFTLFIISSILGLIFLFYLYLITGTFYPEVLLATLGIIFQLIILSSVVILVSTFLNPFLGSIFTIFTYLLGQIIPKAILLAQFYKQASIINALQIVHHIFPDFTYLDFRELLIYNNPVPIDRIVFAFAYAISYSLILVFFAGLIFEKKDL